MHVPPRQVLYDFEHRYEVDDQMVKRKHIINGREYDAMIARSQDPNRQNIKILRTSFIYDKNYFRLETLTNVDGCPTFLRAESHESDEIVKNEQFKLPPFVPVVKDVTRDEEYTTKNISLINYELKY